MNFFNEVFGADGEGNTPHEPPSDLRQAAGMLFSLYTSFMDAGFTPEQAMKLIVEVAVASIAAAGNGDGSQA